MHPWHRLLAAFVACLSLLPALPCHAGPQLDEIKVETVSPGEERVVFKLNGPHIPKIFSIRDDRPRVVFDFTGTAYAGKQPTIIPVNGTMLKTIRVGRHNAPMVKTRVVLDLAGNAPVDLRHQFDETTNTLQISLLRDGTAGAAAAENSPPGTPAPQAPSSLPETSPLALVPTGTGETAGQDGSETATRELPTPLDIAQPVESPRRPLSPQAAKSRGETPPQVPTLSRTAPAGGAGDGRAAPLLKTISFDPKSSRGEMILFQLNDFYPPIVFGIEEGRPRVVCDFMNTTASEMVSRQMETKGHHVERIRTEMHRNPDKLRVVIDMVPEKNYDLQQVFFKEDNLFVLIVNPLPAGGESGKGATTAPVREKK